MSVDDAVGTHGSHRISRLNRGQEINANVFAQSLSQALRVMDVSAGISWTSAPKSAFSCGPGGWEKLFDPWASRRKGQECLQEIRAKV